MPAPPGGKRGCRRRRCRTGEHGSRAGDEQQAGNFSGGEHGLETGAGPNAAQVEDGQAGNGSDGIRRAAPSGRQERQRRRLLHVVAEHEAEQRDRPCRDDGKACPPEQERNRAAEGAVQVMVVAAGVRIGRGQFGVAQRADQRNQAAAGPQCEHLDNAATEARHDGRRLEDAGTDDHADNDGHRFAQADGRAGLRGARGEDSTVRVEIHGVMKDCMLLAATYAVWR